MPLYEYEEGTSRKFYRIDLDGRRVLLHWGRIGTEGEHQILSFETEREARTEFDQQCKKRERDRHYTLVQDEGIPHDPEMVSRQRLEKAAPLSDSPRFLFRKKQRFAWVEARGATTLNVQGLRADEDKLGPVTKEFESPAAAIRARDAVVAKLLASGYELDTFGASEKAEAPVRVKTKLADCSALEGVIAEDPFDDGRWSVLEDFLLEQEDDPRGDLVRLVKDRQIGEEAQSRGACLRSLLGKKHAPLSRAITAPVWRAGYLVECNIALERTPEALLGALLAAPAARLLRDLEIAMPSAKSVSALCTIIVQAPCARSLRRLAFAQRRSGGSVFELDCEMLSGLALRKLSANRQLRLRSVSALDSLEELQTWVRSLGDLQRLVSGALPGLRSLSLDLYEADYGVGIEDREEWLGELVTSLAPIARGDFAPKLTVVQLKLATDNAANVARSALRDGAATRGCELEISP